jgi:hypothetical protein
MHGIVPDETRRQIGPADFVMPESPLWRVNAHCLGKTRVGNQVKPDVTRDPLSAPVLATLPINSASFRVPAKRVLVF